MEKSKTKIRRKVTQACEKYLLLKIIFLYKIVLITNQCNF